jgi:hypothetical protein
LAAFEGLPKPPDPGVALCNTFIVSAAAASDSLQADRNCC